MEPAAGPPLGASAVEKGGPDSAQADARRPITDSELLQSFDEFLYHGEIRDFVKAQHSFERISADLDTDDFDALIPLCLEVLEFPNHYIRNDTLLCLMYISLGCTLCDVPCQALVDAMRKHTAALARHDAMPMLVRSLDFLLGQDAGQAMEEGMLEREFRLIFNCIYLQLLFKRHDETVIQGLELGQGRLGASLISLLFEAAKMCTDNEKIPIKKVILLLLLALQCLLGVPDSALCPSLGPEPTGPAIGPVAASMPPAKPPQLRDFQAFTALRLHERSLRQKYRACGCPAAIEEGLDIVRRYEDDFMMHYAFHPSELNFMQANDFLQDAHERYLDLRARGLVVPTRIAATPAPPQTAPAPSVRTAISSLGTLASEAAPASSPAAVEESADVDSCSSSASERGALSDGGSSASVATVVDLEHLECTPAESGEAAAASDRGALGANGPAPGAGGGAADNPRREPGASRCAASVFHRLYLAIFPCLTETIVLLLRLLLTSCVNVENYPGVVDMARERLATNVSEDNARDSPFLALFEKTMPTESVEAQRHREIIAAGVSGIILILLKQARRSVPEQFSSLAQLITDSNGALVVLKFLNQDLSTAMEPRDAPHVLPCLQLAAGAGEVVHLPSWPACATLRLVEVLYLLCKDSPERVRKFLIHYKAPFILKRLNRIENRQVQRLVLKLLRKQVRYLPRKWKQANMKAISAIYATVPMSPLEDWLLNEPLGDPVTEGPTQADVRTSNVAYNAPLIRQLSAAATVAPVSAAPPPPTVPGEAEASLQQPLPDLASAAAPDGLPTPTAAAVPAGAWRAQAPHVALGSPTAWRGSGAPGGSWLDDELGEDVLGYEHLFPEYVPAACR